MLRPLSRSGVIPAVARAEPPIWRVKSADEGAASALANGRSARRRPDTVAGELAVSGPVAGREVLGSRDLVWGGLVKFLITGSGAAASVALRGVGGATAMLAGCLVLFAPRRLVQASVLCVRDELRETSRRSPMVIYGAW